MRPAAVCYREYRPAPALRGHVGALFTFQPPTAEPLQRPCDWQLEFAAGERLCAPTFADSRACLVFQFDEELSPEGHWHSSTPGSAANPASLLIGPVTVAGPPLVPPRARCLGAYLRPGSSLAGLPLSELVDRAVPLDLVWGAAARRLWEDLHAAPAEARQLACLESALLARLPAPYPAGPRLDILAIARWITRNEGRLPVQQVADAAGLSRQHLARLFHSAVGLSPKLYGELARLQSTLGHARAGLSVDWAQIAADAGYADQSHMIAEFRRFTGLTPQALQRDRWFHPFIERSARRLSGTAAT